MSSPRAETRLEQQRLLEGWLPLAEQTSRLYGWGLDPTALEALVLRAARGLSHSRTVLEAQYSLWFTYQQSQAAEGE